MPALHEGRSVRLAVSLSSRAIAVLSVVALSTLPGCSPVANLGVAPVPPPPTKVAPEPPVPPPKAALEPLSVNGAVPPRLRWRGCGGSFQCATATVPVDYNQPHGATIALSVVRLPAADPAHRIGSLFVNFGGPGTGGVGELESLGPRYPDVLRQRFDLISFDPRGVGGSTPVRCAGPGTAGNVLVGSPVRPEQRAAFFASSAALGQRFPFESTAEQRPVNSSPSPPPYAAAASACANSVSDWMSTFHPVNRAARRAFRPSLPIASAS